MKVITIFILCIIIHGVSSDLVSLSQSPDDPMGSCVLDFTTYPYEPTGECPSDDGTIKLWDLFKTTRCCRNALNSLSKALALNVNNQTSSPSSKQQFKNIYLDQPHWSNCTGSFSLQHSVSLQACGFQNLYAGSGRCSTLFYYPSVLQRREYQAALNSCSGFGDGDDGFDKTCGSCNTAIVALRWALLDEFGIRGDDGDEKASCGLAAVVVVAAGKLSNRSDFNGIFQCLPALDNLSSGYFKIKGSVLKALITATISVIFLLLIILLVKHVTKYKKFTKRCPLVDLPTLSGLYIFAKEEIEKAIGFGKDRTNLGRGSAGQVYKGTLPSGQFVAIKKIFQSNTSDSFQREVQNLSRVRHSNLVGLLGCCMDNGEQYLVYEYCEHGNLAHHLLRKDTILPWELRVKILSQCAHALKYLHQHDDGCIVHRDIKLTNILLTKDMNVKLSDFGLARMLGMNETKVFTDVKGTIGYMDPEYMCNAKLTCASDIYSFGIVALQLLSGQKVIDLDLDARDQLTRKAKDVNMRLRPLSDFEDERLKGNLSKADFVSILEVAVLCVAKSSKGRPSIEIVCEEMDRALKNTQEYQRAKQQMTSPATSLSKPWEVIPV